MRPMEQGNMTLVRLVKALDLENGPPVTKMVIVVDTRSVMQVYVQHIACMDDATAVVDAVAECSVAPQVTVVADVTVDEKCNVAVVRNKSDSPPRCKVCSGPKTVNGECMYHVED